MSNRRSESFLQCSDCENTCCKKCIVDWAKSNHDVLKCVYCRVKIIPKDDDVLYKYTKTYFTKHDENVICNLFNIKNNYTSCSKTECDGNIMENNKCNVCSLLYCKYCKTSDLDNHKCNDDDLQSLTFIMNDTKCCPRCNVNIYKSDGCYMMYCILCKTVFDYNNGNVITNEVIHSPHYNANGPNNQFIEKMYKLFPEVDYDTLKNVKRKLWYDLFITHEFNKKMLFMIINFLNNNTTIELKQLNAEILKLCQYNNSTHVPIVKKVYSTDIYYMIYNNVYY
jgi:hypothetical protein